MGRNPATGEAIKIKASKKIAFRASKDLKEAVMWIEEDVVRGPASAGLFCVSRGLGLGFKSLWSAWKIASAWMAQAD